MIEGVLRHDTDKIVDKNYRKKFKMQLMSNDLEVLAELFAKAPIVGPNGESRFGDMLLTNVGVEFDETVKQIAKKAGFLEKEISMLISEGFTKEDIEKMSKEEIQELLDALPE